jgi:putative addiction module component (TIGR02574 family)
VREQARAYRDCHEVAARCSLENMSGFMEKFGIHQLSVEQRIALIDEIWKSIDGDNFDVDLLSDAQRAEYDGRLDDQDLDEEDLEDLYEIEELVAYSRTRN